MMLYMQNTSSFLSTSMTRKFGKGIGGMSRNKSSKKKKPLSNYPDHAVAIIILLGNF